MSDYYIRKLSYTNNLLKLVIQKDHSGILSNYLLKHLKQEGTSHLEYAIKWKKENAYCELANKEYLEKNKNILINEKLWNGLNIFDYTYANGTLTMVKHLESVGFKNSNDLTFYLLFYIDCEFEVFEYAFCNNAINARIKDSLGRSALFYAARASRIDLFEFLIREEKSLAIDIKNEKDKKGNTLLHYVVSGCDIYNGQNDIDKDYILSRGWDFFDAELSLIKFLLKADAADPSKANAYGQTAFMVVAYWHKEEAIKCLLSTTDSAALSLINQRCCDGRTALHFAAMRGNYKEIINLIEILPHSSAISPLGIGQISITSKNAIEILLKSGADAYKEDNFGCLPLHYACMIFENPTDCELFGLKWEKWPSLKEIKKSIN